jgi:hypothetical protein
MAACDRLAQNAGGGGQSERPGGIHDFGNCADWGNGDESRARRASQGKLTKATQYLMCTLCLYLEIK